MLAIYLCCRGGALGQWAAVRAAAHAVRAWAGAATKAVTGTHPRGAWAASRVRGGRRGGGSGGGAEAADLGEAALDVALVAGEEHLHALALVRLGSGGPRHLALLAVHELVAVRKGVARPRVEDLLAHLVAARQRLRARVVCLGIDVARRGCTGGGGVPQACGRMLWA